MSTSPVLPSVPTGSLANAIAFQRNATLPFLAAMKVGGPIVRVPMGPRTLHVLCTMEAVNEVFVRGGDVWGKHTRGADLLRVVVGNSMLTAHGDTWRQRRKLAQPSFMKASVHSFASTMERISIAHAERWAQASTPLAIDELTMSLTLEVVCEALFGASLGERALTVHHALNDVLSVFIPLLGAPLPSPEKWPLPQSWRLKRAVGQLDTVVHAMVRERRASGGGGTDLLGRLMDAADEGVKLDDTALRDELVTLLLAGHETTANALAWSLALLSKHPGVLRRLEAEIAGIEGPVTDVSTPYLDAVLREAMRLYPPAWILARSANQDTEVAGHKLPKGSLVFACSYALHRGPWFTNPEGLTRSGGSMGRRRVRRGFPSALAAGNVSVRRLRC